MSRAKNPNDSLNSILNELGTAQGYAPKKKKSTKNASKTGNATGNTVRQLLPELSGYPDNSRLTASRSVWNPYVKSETLPDASPIVGVLPTNPQVEVVRRRAYERFKKGFYDLLERFQREKLGGITLPIPSLLEKWHMDCKLTEFQELLQKIQEQGGDAPKQPHIILASSQEIRRMIIEGRGRWVDPILLNSRTSHLSFTVALKSEFQRAWKQQAKKDSDEKELEAILIKLPRKLKTVKRSISKLCTEAMDYLVDETAPNKLQTSKYPPKIKRDSDRDQMTVTHYGLSFYIHTAHFEKLQRLFDRAQQSQQYTVCFEDALFCLLCRYDMLQGAGLQAAIPGRVHDVLLKEVDCQMECFASPLNCRYQNFTAAFDLDRLFGSLGSFFTCSFQSGCYEANPPFCEIVISAMCKRMNTMLTQQQDLPLMFVIFVPVWKEVRAYQLLLKSDFMTHHIVLEAGKHLYAEGSQFRRKESFRVASFDTSVIFYQNQPAREKWPVSDQLVGDLKQAFTTDPESATQPKDESAQYEVDIPCRSPKTAMEATVPSPSDRRSKQTHSGTKEKTRKSKKRTWKNDEEEARGQLNILESLGLTKEAKTDANERHSTTKKKKRKKR